MRFVEVEDLEVGMQPAEDIYDEDNNVLLLDSTKELTEEYIEGLRNMKIIGIYIEDYLSRDVKIKNAITNKQRKKTVEVLQKMDIDAGADEAKTIVGAIIHNNDVSLDMKDMRTFDNYTFYHSVNVAVLATLIGRGMGMNSRELLQLCMAGLFHDLGKTKVDIKLLNKPGKLDKGEFESIKLHSQYGYEILRPRTDLSEQVKFGALYHHENYDGTGYPEGLAADQIPLFARILRVADVYDSLISKRPYKEPFPVNETIEYLLGGSGTLFDNDVVCAFLRSVPIYPKGQKVRLSDGREGFIIANNNVSVLRPKVRLFTGEDIDLTAPEHLTLSIAVTMQEAPDLNDELDRKKLWKSQQDQLEIMVCDSRESYVCLEDEYDVSYMATPKELVTKLVKGKAPDLLIMHVGADGDEIPLAIKIHQVYPKLRTVFVMDKYDMEYVLQLGKVGAVDYLVKPLHPVVLKERIDKAVEPIVAAREEEALRKAEEERKAAEEAARIAEEVARAAEIALK